MTPAAGALAAELEAVEVLDLKPMDASASDVLIRTSAGVTSFNLIPATDEEMKRIPSELAGPLAASCLGPASDEDPIYRYDSAGVRYDFGYFCDDLSRKVIVKGFTEGKVETDRVELRGQVTQISATDPDISLSITVRLKLDGGNCSVETFEETTQKAGWAAETTDLVTPQTTCMVTFAE